MIQQTLPIQPNIQQCMEPQLQSHMLQAQYQNTSGNLQQSSVETQIPPTVLQNQQQLVSQSNQIQLLESQIQQLQNQQQNISQSTIEPQIQVLPNQQIGILPPGTVQGQWIGSLPSYVTSLGQNVVQFQPIQHLHLIQSQATLQHVVPIQVQQSAQVIPSQNIQDHHQPVYQQNLPTDFIQYGDPQNLQIKLPDQKVTYKADSDVNSESNISRLAT